MSEKKNNIEIAEFDKLISEKYLSYALSTIMSRSLPDLRDGLKPVHRRLLYAMYHLKLNPNSGFKKCARVVGDVIGKYHPHGDVAVYESLVRMAQSFSLRYPLIEGQGNFGSIDGDNAAAMRYTESRLTNVALELLDDLEKETVEFKDNYDGSDQEPVILPGRFPNLLANGSEGIAVGMATSIPPHNVDEICDALSHLVKKPECTIAELTEFIKGPDFPTGGIIIDKPEYIKSVYETGKGSIRVRAKWEKEILSHGLYQIVITEIPYQVQKSKLLEKLAEIYKLKKLPILGNISDESAEDIRIIIEPKNRSVDANLLMESLFKMTDLEIRFNVNMNVLRSNGLPDVLNLKQILQDYLDYRFSIVKRKTQYRLNQINKRLELLEGFLIVYLNLDEVIRIIREEDNPKEELIKTFNLTDLQAEAILNMRLRSLRKLEEMEITTEKTALNEEKKTLEKIIDLDKECWKVVTDEVKSIKKKFGKHTEIGKRRTIFEEAEAIDLDLSKKALIEKEPITIICSEKGWIRSIKGFVKSGDEIKYKENDQASYVLFGYTTDNILIATKKGKFFTIEADRLSKGKGFGEPIRIVVDMASDDDIINMFLYSPEKEYVLASKKAKGFIVEADNCLAHTKNGKQIFNLSPDDELKICKEIKGNMLAIIGENRKMIVYEIEELPKMKKGSGVLLQRYKDGDLSDVTTYVKEEGISWKLGERTRRETDLTAWSGKKGQTGKLAPNGFPRNNKFES